MLPQREKTKGRPVLASARHEKIRFLFSRSEIVICKERREEREIEKEKCIRKYRFDKDETKCTIAPAN